MEHLITASELTDEFDVLVNERGSPTVLRMGNGPEFISKALRSWARRVDLVFIPPEQPWRNGFIESFNGRLRDEGFSVNHFPSLNYAKAIIGIWQEEFDQTRAHLSWGYLAPTLYPQNAELRKTS